MKIDTRVVPQGRSGFERELLLDEFKDSLPPFSEKIRASAELDRMGETIVAKVHFEGVFDMQCSRCLEDCGVTVNGEARVILKEEDGRYGASPDDDGIDFFFDVNHEVVDISSAVYDEIMTALPLKPLCSRDCGGIKLSGGGGVSFESGESGDGDDKEKPVDPRWEALKKLKKDNG